MNSSTTSSNQTGVPPVDPYEVLGVDRQADDAAIKKAYFKLVRAYPPESEPEKFQEVRASYERLRSAERRAQTDLFLLQAPPTLPKRRAPHYDLSVHVADLVRLAFEWRVAQISVQDDFHEPTLPT